MKKALKVSVIAISSFICFIGFMISPYVLKFYKHQELTTRIDNGKQLKYLLMTYENENKIFPLTLTVFNEDIEKINLNKSKNTKIDISTWQYTRPQQEFSANKALLVSELKKQNIKVVVYQDGRAVAIDN